MGSVLLSWHALAEIMVCGLRNSPCFLYCSFLPLMAWVRDTVSLWTNSVSILAVSLPISLFDWAVPCYKWHAIRNSSGISRETSFLLFPLERSNLLQTHQPTFLTGLGLASFISFLRNHGFDLASLKVLAEIGLTLYPHIHPRTWIPRCHKLVKIHVSHGISLPLPLHPPLWKMCGIVNGGKCKYIRGGEP